jgi:hypothetical protein
VLAFDRQAIEDGFSKWAVGDLEFEETLLLGCLALCLAERVDEVASGVARGGVPGIDGDEDLLAKERVWMRGSRQETGGDEDGLEGEGGDVGGGEGGTVDVAGVAGGWLVS